MDTTITCPKCHEPLDIPSVLAEQSKKAAKLELDAQYKIDLEREKKQAADEAAKKATEELLLRLKDKENETSEAKQRNQKYQEELLEKAKLIRDLKEKDEERDLVMEKKLAEEKERMQEEIAKKEHEKSSLEKRELEKQIQDMKKALEEANRKGSQKSQQLQGEVLELQIEELLQEAFPHDEIAPIGKGVRGADINHIVKSPRGFRCGLILWEFKRTQNWDKTWIPKLKENARSSNADISVIITTTLPKDMPEDFGVREDVWVCSIHLVIPLAIALRKCLLDVGYQKAISVNKGSKAEMLYSLVTSNEFIQQFKTIVDVYNEIQIQIQRERVAYEKLWKQREGQSQRLFSAVTTIVGSIQGKIGASTLHIPELELLETGDES